MIFGLLNASTTKLNITKMKFIKFNFTSLALILISLTTFAQKGIEDGSRFGKGDDSVRCVRNYSLYREYYKQKNYQDAIPYWKIVYQECPTVSKAIYQHGVNMYKFFIVEANNKNDLNLKTSLIDTLLQVYDQRVKYYPADKGRVLGYKANDILTFRENDIECMKKAYGFSSEAITIRKTASSKNDIATFMKLTLGLFDQKEMENQIVVENYATAIDILDSQLERNPDDEDLDALKESIQANFANSGAANCEALIQLFTPQFNETPDNVDVLKKISYWLNSTGCTESDLYLESTIALNLIEPSASLAYHIAQLYNKRGRHQDAVDFYKQAIATEENMEAKAKYEIDLGYIILGEYNDLQEAAKYAKAAMVSNPKSGHPYMLLGNIYALVKNYGDDELAKKSIYWVAVDQYQMAKKIDPDLASMANEKINLYSQYFPDTETIFFYGFKDGDSYKVGSWINLTTKVRTR